MFPKRRHFQIKQLIRKHKGDNTATVLEIGCGLGTLASILPKNEGFNYIGFEPSQVRAEFCKKRGLNVIHGFYNFESINDYIDAIVIDNVLEHVFEPKTLICDMLSVLKKDGILIIIVPNLFDVRQYVSSYWYNRHHWQPQCHINYFCSKDLKYIFKDYNIKMKSFDVSLLDFNKIIDLLYVPKYLLDRLGLYLMGLSFYVINKS